MSNANRHNRLGKKQSSDLWNAYARMSAVINRCLSLVLHSFRGQISPLDYHENQAHIDMLLDSVMLLHGGFEDFLRSIGRLMLPSSSVAALDRVPLRDASDANAQSPVAFLLDALLQFRGDKVDDVIAKSVDRYLQRRTFNSTSQVSGFLKELGIVVDVRSELPQRSRLMIRRHQIVHQADFSDTHWQDLNVDSEYFPTSHLEWSIVVGNVAIAIVKSLAPKGQVASVQRLSAGHFERSEPIRLLIENLTELLENRGERKDIIWRKWIESFGP